MNIAKRLLRFLFPPSRWQGCQPMRDAERMAQYELRMGAHRAAERLRGERVNQVIDRYVASKAPERTNNVISIRRRRVK